MLRFIKLKCVMLLGLALAQSVLWSQEPMWVKYHTSCKVNGTPNITSFVESIFNCSVNDWDGENVLDVRNGYFSHFQEGAGSIRINVSYWNRKDGKKLVVMAYEQNDFGENTNAIVSSWGHMCWEPLPDISEGVVKEAGFIAYLYDAQKKQLEPLDNPPFKGFDGPKEAIYYLELPQKGKDIIVREHVTGTYYSIYHYLRWNGMEFDFEESSPQTFYVRITNSTLNNLCNEPDGEEVAKVGDDATMNIDYIFSDWCHISGGELYYPGDENVIDLPKNEYWIHNSMIGATGRGNGNVTLYAEPKEGATVVYTNDEEEFVHPIQIVGEWIKIRVDGKDIEGWIKAEDICSNALTNCC